MTYVLLRFFPDRWRAVFNVDEGNIRTCVYSYLHIYLYMSSDTLVEPRGIWNMKEMFFFFFGKVLPSFAFCKAQLPCLLRHNLPIVVITQNQAFYVKDCRKWFDQCAFCKGKLPCLVFTQNQAFYVKDWRKGFDQSAIGNHSKEEEW